MTITAGGNDLGYVGTLLAGAAVTTVARRLPLLSASRRERLGDLVRFRTTPESNPEAFAAVAAAQAEIVERARERAPHSRLLLIDYLTLIEPTPDSSSTISLGIGVLVGVGYGLLKVRSPAPPPVALVGLLGMQLGQQLISWLHW